jgi:glycosyltransferase involved in cell wall biosynthesis
VFRIAVLVGVPVVASAVGEFAGVITNRLNGLLVPLRNPASLARAILEVFRESCLRARLIENLVAVRQGRFLWFRIVSQTLHVYQQAILRERTGGRQCI